MFPCLQRTGGGGAAAAFAHDDRTGMGGFADDSYAMGNAGSGMGSVARMGGRLQRRSAAGAGDRWQHDMFDPRETPVTPRRAGRLAGAPPSLPTRVFCIDSGAAELACLVKPAHAAWEGCAIQACALKAVPRKQPGDSDLQPVRRKDIPEQKS
eukprot:1158008-Pelagomonas_calceolata.AAC.1